MSNGGTKKEQFDVPVCNSFKAKVLNDQLCYEMDPNKLKSIVSEKDFFEGFKFYVDTNVDRQFPIKSKEASAVLIYLHTVGKLHNLISA